MLHIYCKLQLSACTGARVARVTKQEQVVVRVGVLTQLPGLATQVPPGYTV